MRLHYLRLLAILLVALSLGASFAHVLELPAKLALDAAEYRLVQRIYVYFGVVGAVLEPVSIAALVWLAAMSRHRPSFGWTLAALSAIVTSLVAWLVLVSPMNAEMARWTGDMPASWTATRDRWEWGHVTVFALKLLGMVSLLASVAVAMTRPRRESQVVIAP